MGWGRLIAAAWVLGACSPAAPPASCKTSCHEGATQCHDAHLIGTCTLLADGCYAFVSVPCPDGQYCDDDMNRCEPGDLCSPAGTLSACTRAAMNLAQCCNYNPDPLDLCETELALGLDPLAACTHLHSISCDVFHGELLPGCCCPPGWICDANSTNCLKTCQRSTDCPTGQTCGPYGLAAAHLPNICAARYSCGYEWPCPEGYCCVGDVNGNRFCATGCDDSSMCPWGGRCDGFAYIDPACGITRACGQ